MGVDLVERRNIKLGAKYEDLIVVSDGLNGDEQVVINGIQRARVGAQVVTKSETLKPVEGTLDAVEQSPPTSAKETPSAAADQDAAPNPATDSAAGQPQAPAADPEVEGKPADNQEVPPAP